MPEPLQPSGPSVALDGVTKTYPGGTTAVDDVTVDIAGGSFVALVGTARQRGYGNVRLREALIIGALSPLGVLAGVAASNLLPERALQLAFAALALFMAAHLVRRARAA